MASRSKRYPKLRFALITEDALERLRPETPKSDDPPKTKYPLIKDDKALVETIDNVVNTLIERKLQFFKVELDRMIEDKIVALQNRQQDFRKSMQLSKNSLTESYVSEGSLKISLSDFETSTKTSKRTKKVKKAKPTTGDGPSKKKMKTITSNHNKKIGDGYVPKPEIGKRSMRSLQK